MSFVITTLKVITIVLYIIALFLPAFVGYSGYVILAVGIFSLVVTNFFGFLAWSSNVLLLGSFLNFFNHRTKLIISLLAVVFGFMALNVNEVMVTEGGNMERISMAVGFWFWISSLIVNLLVRGLEYQEKLGKKVKPS